MSETKALSFSKKEKWLVTGAAGFIGSHAVEALISGGQDVVGLDNFLTGSKANIAKFLPQMKFIEGDIRDVETCAKACAEVDRVLHFAALGSVPRSLKEPRLSFEINAQGFVNVIEAARNAKVKRLVYSSSSSVYGDDPSLPKRENIVGQVLSPYAASKRTNELTAEIYHRSFDFSVVGLRYFNVFGPRQSPEGPYAAVIPQWILNLKSGHKAVIYGDGSTSRDFCPVANVIAANLAAATAEHATVAGRVYNIALGQRTTLIDLHGKIVRELKAAAIKVAAAEIEFAAWRKGDILHSHADISRAQSDLKYSPQVTVDEGLKRTVRWFLDQPANVSETKI